MPTTLPPPKADPKSLLLDLLLAVDDTPLPVRDAVCAAALFGISENHLRVTLARLGASGFVEATERGAYRLGPAARRLAHDVATWRTTEQRLRPWQGDYVAVHCTALSRSVRPALRQRHRALHMLGFAELQRDFYVRPNNMERDVDAIRQRLYALGLDPQALVFAGAAFDTATEAHIRTLWDGAALNAQYQSQRDHLLAWLAQAGQLDIAQAARESFFLGGQAIRHIVYDPFLPEPLVDVALRHAFIATVQQFDSTGRAIWSRFFQSLPTP